MSKLDLFLYLEDYVWNDGHFIELNQACSNSITFAVMIRWYYMESFLGAFWPFTFYIGTFAEASNANN